MKKILIALLVLVVMTMLVRCYNDDDVDNDIVIEKSCPPREIDISQEIGEKKFSKPYVINKGRAARTASLYGDLPGGTHRFYGEHG